MFRLGIIEESLGKQRKFISQYVENAPEDECPLWHTNKYHVPEDKICELLDL